MALRVHGAVELLVQLLVALQGGVAKATHVGVGDHALGGVPAKGEWSFSAWQTGVRYRLSAENHWETRK